MEKTFDQLSTRQQNILRFIDRHLKRNGYPPTIRQIGEATAIGSTSVVNYNLNKLVEAGFLERAAGTSRGLRITREIPGGITEAYKGKPVLSALDTLAVAHLGRISAGIPIEVPQDITSRFDEESAVLVTEDLVGRVDPKEIFALTVKGDSMIDAMIQDGDTVILRAARTAHNGEMVAAWLPEREETTLKYFYHEGHRIRLQPAHPMMEPIYVEPANCQIHGKVLAVLRRIR